MKAQRTPVRGYPGIYRLETRSGVTYEVRYRAPDPATGTRRQFSASFPRLQEASSFQDEQKQARRTGRHVAPSAGKRTFGELFEAWLASKPRKPRTIEGYRDIYHVHLAHWGRRPVASVTPADVRAILSALVGADRSPSTIHNVFNVVRGVLSVAVVDNNLAANPADALRSTLPKRRTKLEPRALTKEEANTLAQQFTGPGRLLVSLAAWSGLRRGELAGLQTADLNEVTSTLTVRRTARRKGGEWLIGTPKSKESQNRVVPLPPALTRALLELGQDKVYVFGGDEPFNVGVFYTEHFRRLAPGIRLHDLRHTFARIKLEQGYRLDEVKKWMGHSTIATTVDLYARFVPVDDEARRARDDAAFLGSPANVVQLPTQAVHGLQGRA